MIKAILCIALCLITQISAQIGVRLALSQSQYLAGEPVLLQVAVTNHTGNPLTLANTGKSQWLQINVKKGNGELASVISRPSFAAMKVGIAQTKAQVIDLSKFFHLQTVSNFSVEALVISSGSDFPSNRLLFSMSEARADWSQKVGVPGKPGKSREFRLMNYSNGQKTQLYMQIADVKTGISIKTFSFGEALMIRKPQAAVDRNQVLNVLYLGNPEFYVHARVDINGMLLGRELYKRDEGPDPRLMTFADGTVKVAGTAPYNAKAALEAKQKIRKASDRPKSVFQ